MICVIRLLERIRDIARIFSILEFHWAQERICFANVVPMSRVKWKTLLSPVHAPFILAVALPPVPPLDEFWVNKWDTLHWNFYNPRKLSFCAISGDFLITSTGYAGVRSVATKITDIYAHRNIPGSCIVYFAYAFFYATAKGTSDLQIYLNRWIFHSTSIRI